MAIQQRSSDGLVGRPQTDSLADVLERVLDKGIVIAGDIQVNLLDIELLTIKLRLVIASVDRAKEMGIDWWEHDPTLSSRSSGDTEMVEENRRLRERVAALESGDRDDPYRGRDDDPYRGRDDDRYDDPTNGRRVRNERRSRRPSEGNGRG
jgi:hypothetical protein